MSHFYSASQSSASSANQYAAWVAAPHHNKQYENNPALYSVPAQTLRAKPSLAVTEIETDFEDDAASDFEEEFYRGRRSEDSTSKHSEATLSSFDEIRTPNSNSIGFTFQHIPVEQHYVPTLRRSKAMEGPSGPSLFRMSQESSVEMEVVLTMSPPTSPQDLTMKSMVPNFHQPALRTYQQFEQLQQNQQQQQIHPEQHLQPAQQERQQQHVFQEAPRTSVPLRTWTPWQVADWMHALGFERSIIDQFFVNDISGLTLIDLQYDDLKELGISSFGQRHRLWNEIKTLKDQTLASNLPPTPGPEAPWQQQHGEPSPALPLPSQREPTPPQQCTDVPEAVARPVKGRRAMRRAITSEDVISPAESASIVAIEQLLPEPHVCEKGEACSKWRKQQRKLKKIATEFPLEYSQIVEGSNNGGRVSPSNDSGLGPPASIAVPSLIASSDLLGPAVPKVKLAEENLKGLLNRDPQENVRQFLDFQHVTSPAKQLPDTPPYEMFPPLSPPDTTAPAHGNLRSLPKLTIPAGKPGSHAAAPPAEDMTARPTDRSYTPVTAVYGNRAPVHDIYRVGTPASEMDVPVTALPLDPLGPNARDVSSSVPPDMRYGGPGDLIQQVNPRPIQARERGPPIAFFNHANNSASLTHYPPPPQGARRRSTSQTGMRPRRPSFGMSPLAEITSPIGVTLPTRAGVLGPEAIVGNRDTLATEIEDEADDDNDAPLTPGPQHAGYMRKRRTRMLRHEWNEAHYRLTGTQLSAHRDATSREMLDCIDVDDYAVAVAANQSKLNAAMKRLRLNGKDKGDDVWKYGFQLTPAADGSAARSKVVERSVGKTHHFAVQSANDRIDWMRELMLARAKKDKDAQHERFD